MFQTKDFLSIVASMVNRMRATNAQVTDYNVGSVARTMVEAPAQEIDELYQQMVHAVVEAIPVSVYTSFNFPALGAIYASGLVQVSFAATSAGFTIAAGTTLTPAGSAITYTVLSSVVVAPGSTSANLSVVAGASGVGGNIAAGTSWTLSPAPVGFVSASNPSAFINGSQAETDAQHKLRFNAYVSTLAKGTLAAVYYGTTGLSYLTDSTGAITERAQLCQIVEPWVLDHTQPVGQFTLYIHNGVGGTSLALLQQVQAVIYGSTNAAGAPVAGFKSAGVQVQYLIAAEVVAAVTGILTAAVGYTHAALVTLAQQAISSYILGLGIGAGYQVATIYETVMSIPGVANFNLSSPAADVAGVVGQKFMPGLPAIS